MKIELKKDIFIEGFDAFERWNNYNLILNKCLIRYSGETSNIPEEIAKSTLDWMFWDEKIEQRRYKNYNYKPGGVVKYPYTDYKDSINSACDKPFCIIYKEKNIEKEINLEIKGEEFENVLVGKEKGEEYSSVLNIKEFYKKYDNIVLNIPDRIMVINASFFDGLLSGIKDIE